MSFNKKIKLDDVVEPNDSAAFAVALGGVIHGYVIASEWGTTRKFCKANGITLINYGRVRTGEHYPSDVARSGPTYRITVDLLEDIAKALKIPAIDIVETTIAMQPTKRSYNEATVDMAVLALEKKTREKRGVALAQRTNPAPIGIPNRYSYGVYLSQAIIECMQARGLKRADLIARSGISSPTIYALLPVHSEMVQDSSVSTFVAIANALNVELHVLMKRASLLQRADVQRKAGVDVATTDIGEVLRKDYHLRDVEQVEVKPEEAFLYPAEVPLIPVKQESQTAAMMAERRAATKDQFMQALIELAERERTPPTLFERVLAKFNLKKA